jgi:Zn-dependent protease
LGAEVLNLSIAELFKILPAILLGLTIHELAHAFMALKLGDDISINVSLGIFNLLPIPPLDGSHVIWSLLSKRSASGAAIYFKYGSYALLGLILVERITKLDILPIGMVVNSVVMVFLRVAALS